MNDPATVEKPGLRLVKGATYSGRSLRILLVEDHADSAEAMIAILDRRQHRVHWVGTGAAALEVLQRAGAGSRPDVVILDLMLPDMTGVEIVEQLRQDAAALPPIVVLSAKPLATIRAEAQAVGAAAYLRKPFSIDDLLATVESAAPGTGR
jgi:two-component system, OmpR family, response regulator